MSARGWQPVAAETDLVPRHIHHGQLPGQEFAIWRADDGHINVWENRCLHRGVRLSIGVSDGRELKCQYHGWRYANRTAGCTYIPAHPADAPARTICNRVFPARLHHGLVWTTMEEATAPLPAPAALARGAALVLRAIPVNAPPATVLEALEDYDFHPEGKEAGSTRTEVCARDGGALTLTAAAEGTRAQAVFFVQPVDSARAVIRGLLPGAPLQGEASLGLLRHHDTRLSRLRDRIEEAAARLPAPEPVAPVYAPVPEEWAGLPEPAAPGRAAPLRVSIARKWATAEDVAGFELVPLSGTLPTPQPGAHVDVHLPSGLVRQYSLLNAPGETAHYVIGVKRETPSTGGSAALHDALGEGDVLALSEPRNNFPLRRDVPMTLLVAGGIGLTPLLAMAHALEAQGLAHELHVFARSPAHLPFPERLAGLGDRVVRHIGLGPADTEAELARLFAGGAGERQVYLCGPAPMLAVARQQARDAGWPDERVHFEYFANPTEIDDSSAFDIALARSALTLQVPSGRTILSVLREHGIALPSSCEQGACGTCVVPVLEGEPEHFDVFLNDAEKTSGERIVTCVSRARSARLVLDI